jgi:tetratricopeptide repeat protein
MIRTALVSVLCVVAILIVVPQVTEAKDSLYEQKMARGVLAFESGKFPEAAGEFQAALSEKPDDPAATLYLGIAQSRSGDPRAESTLKKAVGLNPKDARANFELGILYYQRNIPEEANDYFETAASLSPGSEIAARSQEFKRASGERKGAKAKSWALSLGLRGQYDSNVVLSPSGASLPQGISRKSDYRTVALLDGRYRFLSGPRGDLSAGYGLYRSWHRDLSGFDVIRHALDLRGGIPVSSLVSVEAAYIFEYLDVSSEMFSYSNGVSAGVTFHEGKDHSTSLRYQYRHSGYGAAALYPANPDRDGDSHLFGLTQRASFGKNLSASAGYAHDEDRAKQAWWDAKGDKVFAATGVSLPYRTRLGFSGEYYRKKYDAVDPQFTILREDKTATVSATAGISFSDHCGLSVGYAYVKNDSSISVLEYTRSIVSATLTARF